MAKAQHNIPHVEYATPDPAKAQKFYEKVFGWQFDTMPADYRFASIPGGTTLGIRKTEPNEPPATLSYVGVGDLEASLREARAAGAKVVVEKTEIPQFGHYAVLILPGELTLGLYQPL